MNKNFNTDKQQQQKKLHDSHCCELSACTFSVGEEVFVKNNLKGKKWIPGSPA